MKRQEIISQLFETMDVAKRALHARMQIMLAGCPVSHSQLELLMTIDLTQPVTATQLAERLHLTPGAISQLIEELDKKQLIRRQTDPNDRRKQVLHVSPGGNELLKTITARRRHYMQSVIENLTDEELAVWLKIQHHMIHAIKDIDNTKRKET